MTSHDIAGNRGQVASRLHLGCIFFVSSDLFRIFGYSPPTHHLLTYLLRTVAQWI